MELNKKKSMRIGVKKDIIFCCIMLLWPVLQFCIFYIGVNFNSFLLAFRKITMNLETKTYDYAWSVGGFKKAWELVKSPDMIQITKWSLLFYIVGLCTSVPLGLLFSYYIAKKFPAAGAFRVILFLPSILSSIVMVTLFSYFTDMALPKLMENMFGIVGKEPLLSSNSKGTVFTTITAYNIWVSFGVNVLMYANAMSGIAPEVIESAHLEGAYGLKEFWHISIPMIFPTLSVFLTVGVAGIFTNQHNLFSFFGNRADPPLQSYGYYLFRMTNRYKSDMSHYPELSAFGLMMTAVAVPLTFLVKNLLEKYGPSED